MIEPDSLTELALYKHHTTDTEGYVPVGADEDRSMSDGLDREPVDEAFQELKDARYYWGKPAGGQTIGQVRRARDLLNEALPSAYVEESDGGTDE